MLLRAVDCHSPFCSDKSGEREYGVDDVTCSGVDNPQLFKMRPTCVPHFKVTTLMLASSRSIQPQSIRRAYATTLHYQLQLTVRRLVMPQLDSTKYFYSGAEANYWDPQANNLKSADFMVHERPTKFGLAEMARTVPSVPIFLLEVMSPSNFEAKERKKLREKIRNALMHGCQFVWVVYPNISGFVKTPPKLNGIVVFTCLEDCPPDFSFHNPPKLLTGKDQLYDAGFDWKITAEQALEIDEWKM